MKSVFCVHCGRIYIVTQDTNRSECVCGSDLYPFSHNVVEGEELELADGYRARVSGIYLISQDDS